ncbi:hypothetical protein GLOIN_2v1874888 [Rhizophagus irregularis DAOM 181602=DAOM 197198]|nr:hypothetical protein GLOIN_2v1874888 [Rhizophagus irregularis DAOM 181602=DAOM 197198]
MIINLLMGDKKAKEDGNRYVLCDAVLLVGRYLDELKWAVVHDFFEEEKIPFTAVTHSEISEIDSFDPTQATVVIFEDLMDAPKKIQDLITEESESLAPVIDDLTLQREFVVFDLRRSKSNPLSIRFDPSLNPVRSQSEPSSITVRSKFSPYSQKANGRTAKTETLKTENVKELFSRYEALKATWTVEHYK